MRIAREDWDRLDPADVAWVAEWQLALHFPWVPRGEECPVLPAPSADVERLRWDVRLRVGRSIVAASLPLRDLARVILWCHGVSRDGLASPPATIRAGLQAIREALGEGLRAVDPLDVMGYRGDPPAP